MAKYAIISDLHIGVHRSDPKYLQWALDYVEFLVRSMKDNGTDLLLILGDVFHNRKEVSTIAIETARKFFSVLRDNGMKVDVIPGNHDCYYEANTNATSLALLSGWDNVSVHYEPFDMNIDGANGLMVPWGADLSPFKGKKFDFIAGHFEITSFNMTTTQVCEDGISSDSLFEIAPLVFSGHFHLRCDRGYDSGNRIIYVGSPYELDWGDYASTKGIYFYDTATKEILFAENKSSPKHVRLEYDPDIATDKAKAQRFKEQLQRVNGNIVKLVSNDSAGLKQKDLQKIIEMVNKLSPGEFTCDLTSSPEEEDLLDDVDISSTLDPKDALVAYIDAKYPNDTEEIKKIVLGLYSQTNRV